MPYHVRQEKHTQSQRRHRHCDWEGCAAEGEYPAPKSPDKLAERHMFCLEHVRQYNKTWNFFERMSPRQMEDYWKSSLSGHRPTWHHSTQAYHRDRAERVRSAFHQMFGEEAANHQNGNVKPDIPENEREALATLGLSPPVVWNDIKKRYKELVKRHHPDIAGKQEEERFKQVVAAYAYIKECGAYPA